MRITLIIALFGCSLVAFPSRAAEVWTPVLLEESLLAESTLGVDPDACSLVTFDADEWERRVQDEGPWQVDFPLPDGSFKSFGIVSSTLMHPELAEKFPQIKTYSGQSEDGDTLRLDVSPVGLRAQILSEQGTLYIDPVLHGNAQIHAAFDRRAQRRNRDWQCHAPAQEARMQLRQQFGNRVNDGLLRSYRLAVGATGEYTQFHGGTVSDAMAAIVTTINRVTGIYERELSITFQLVGNNELVVYTDPLTDGYDNSNANALLTQNQTKMDTLIGAANYDIGHVFSTDSGGLALPGVVCVEGEKAMGSTGDDFPMGDSFDVDFVTHEMGHQFGANHTFNGLSSSCAGNRTSTTAYEPGSGTTIMGYAGLCSLDNVQSRSDDYFHSISLDQISAYVTAGHGAGCAANTPIANRPPIVDAGPAYTIPLDTPFTLTASGSDPDGDLITYCWEERDLGPARALTAPDNGVSPLFRSRPPLASPSRTFPRLAELLAGSMPVEERLPVVGRAMSFRVTVRDNRPGGGAFGMDDTAVDVDGSAGPFRVTQPNQSVFWSGAEVVEWDVANTINAAVNAATVNILLSLDGGTNFPITLVANTPNDGSEAIVLPNVSALDARIKIEAIGNIFFDVSNESFTINPSDLLQVSPQTDQMVTGPSGMLSGLPCFDYTATNAGFAVIDVAAGASETWISAMPESVSVPGMDATNVAFCLNGTADALAPGEYTSIIYIANQITSVTNQWTVFLTVEPSGGIFAFRDDSLAPHEDDGVVSIEVQRSGFTAAPASLSLTAVDATANRGSDYQLLTESLDWAAGETTAKFVQVEIFDDLLPELSESFSLQLGSSSPHIVLGAFSNLTAVILDNDAAGINDRCTNAIEVTALPFSNTQSTTLLTSVGDPVPSCGVNGANGGWVRLTPPATGLLTIDTSGSSFNTVVAAYLGDCGALTEFGCDNDSGAGLNARLQVPVYVGEPILILAGGFNGSSGTLALSMDLAPLPADCFNRLLDGDFEGTPPNDDWTVQTSTQFGSVICDSTCNPDPSYAAPNSGTTWAWFGTTNGNVENASVGQIVYIPHGVATLKFQLWIATVVAPFTDMLNVEVDGQVVMSYPEPSTADTGYSLREIDVSAFADGGVHELLFTYSAPGGGDSDYNVDDVELEVCQDDFDNDGMPNSWEQANGLNAIDAADALQDGDDDFMSNRDEYIAGTGPGDPHDRLRILLEVPPSVVLGFDSVTGRTYAIDFSAVLMPPSWQNLVTNLPGTGASIAVTNTTIQAVELYRVRATLP